MSQTSIEWTQHTWNPVRGCSRVSPGCQHCYAERMAARNLPGMKSPTTGEPFAIMKSDGPHWTGRVELIENMLDIPLPRKKPTTWFVNSMSDLFHEGLPDEDIDRVFAVIALSPQHTFQILTKRAERMRRYSSWQDISAYREPRDMADRIGAAIEIMTNRAIAMEAARWPLPNVWLGVSIEDRARRDRIEHLRQTPAALRFLSCEPLLEDLGELDLRGIGWVIVGGESGPGGRPMDLAWARSIRDQCRAAGVKFFMKQMGSRPRSKDAPEFVDFKLGKVGGLHIYDRKGGDPAEWPEDLRLREMPQ